MTTKAIIFDYGDVLDHVDDHTLWDARRSEIAARFGMSAAQFWSYVFSSDAWQECKHGRINHDEFWNRVLTPLGVSDPKEQQTLVDYLYEGRDWVNPEMAALLRELKPHYRLGVLSNTYDTMMEQRIVEKHGLRDLFDVVISSAKVGLAKPEPESYMHTLEKLAVKPEEALFVDDMTRNTIAAEALGLPSIVFKSPTQLRRELEARAILPVPQKSK
jgi:putative hydrolase of the HAD superfamily